MRTSESLRAIAPNVNRREAEARVMQAGSAPGATVVERVLYPYFVFDATCAMPALAGRRRLGMHCLVDAMNGIGATADPFETIDAPRRRSRELKPEIDAAAAGRTAERTVTHRLSKRLRTVASFDATLEPGGIVYKIFWIVDCGGYRVLVDSVTGGLHPLAARAA